MSMHAKYKVSISNGLKVIVNVKARHWKTGVRLFPSLVRDYVINYRAI